MKKPKLPGEPVGDTPIWITIFINILKVWFAIYDKMVALPFAIFASPAAKLARSSGVKAKQLNETNVDSPWRNVRHFDSLMTEKFDGCDTLDQLWFRLVKVYEDQPCMGTRDIVTVESEKQPNGRVFEKLVLADQYNFLTYGDADNVINNIAMGLKVLGHDDRTPLVIYAETCANWMLTAQACFRRRIPVVTVYATLGEEAIIGAIESTEATTIVTSNELVGKLGTIFMRCNTLKRAVVFPARLPNVVSPVTVETLSKEFQRLAVISFNELQNRGEDKIIEVEEDLNDDDEVTWPTAEPNDIALIMYTSGTTGTPKGVIISHSNLIAATAAQSWAIDGLGLNDTYVAYLPLAHILEVAAEMTCFSSGCPVGYSSPLTLHDRASKIKRGTRGDCAVLRPTVLAAVPAIMDRIFKAVMEDLSQSSILKQQFFRLTYERKRNRIEDGYDDPFLNRIVFAKTRQLLGGSIRGLLCGGAPLNVETQRFMNICFCCPLVQGYGLTETCGAGTICDLGDLSCGSAGPPLPCNDIMLRDWEEGGYRTTNKPRSQGEVLLGGANVSLGYWKNEAKTAEDFVTIEGRRWFCSGDIGEFRDDGSLFIIDRKKDMVKLSHGEYISPARVETALSTHPIVDNICVYANSFYAFPVALLVPNVGRLTELARQTGIDVDDWTALCRNETLNKEVLKQLAVHGAKGGLEKMELPQKLHLCEEPWTPQMDLLTEALKLKRKPIADFYSDALKAMYEDE